MRNAIIVLVIVLFSGCILCSCDSQELSREEDLAFRTFVSSIRLEAQVAACRSQMPVWQSEYPDALKDWLARNDRLIRSGRQLFEQKVVEPAAKGPRKITFEEALSDIRKEAIDQVSAPQLEHIVATCRAIGDGLTKSQLPTPPVPTN